MPNPAAATAADAPCAFGLIVIGDEVLNGNRVDAHLPAFKDRLCARGHELAWYWLLPDEPGLLTRQLAASMAEPNPVFCCGGIGATPDDHTRACAAAAAGVALVRHPGAQGLIEAGFGPDAYPHRILMADLPAGASLIPNRHNGVPGFALNGHCFLPGFPQMAGPMAEWVLDEHYGRSTPLQERAVRVVGVPESRLVPLMRDLGPRFPQLKLFSLPHMGDDPHILIGFRGRGDLEAALQALTTALHDAGLRVRPDTPAHAR